jgi:hypothetical protein
MVKVEKTKACPYFYFETNLGTLATAKKTNKGKRPLQGKNYIN